MHTISRSVELRVPNLDLAGFRTFVACWHAAKGQSVRQGERLVEITAGDVTVELSAPAAGRLVERCAEIDEPLAAGQVLARLELE